jgi:Asp-tRNA(Asn)/Glu-tRNA(Gln) amidotransferase A subunit family amidase
MRYPAPGRALVATLAAFLRSDADRYLDWLEIRFDELEPGIKAFLPEAGRFDRLREDLEHLETRFDSADRRPPLFGLPFGVKDIFHADGFPTRAGSRLPAEILRGEQAESVGRLREAGGLILGKTVTTEFAYFAPGPTENPHQPGHTPGGSSSGSAAAVASGLAPVALGTQTIGSINRPAAFCGTVGFKPSFGRISAQGVIPLSPSLDQVGYFTVDAGSAAFLAPLLMDDWPLSPAKASPLRLGIPTGPYLDRAEPAGRAQFQSVVGELQRAGHATFEIDCMPDFDAITARHQLILAAECARVHSDWFDQYPDRYHPKTAALIEAGRTISADDLERALPGRQSLRLYLEGLMDEHALDAWITPSAPGPAPFGLDSTGDPVMNLPWTQSGMPTVTLPSGKNAAGLPFGLQLIARFWQDAALLECARSLEPVLDYESMHGMDEFLKDIA